MWVPNACTHLSHIVQWLAKWKILIQKQLWISKSAKKPTCLLISTCCFFVCLFVFKCSQSHFSLLSLETGVYWRYHTVHSYIPCIDRIPCPEVIECVRIWKHMEAVAGDVCYQHTLYGILFFLLNANCHIQCTVSLQKYWILYKGSSSLLVTRN